MSEEDKGGTAQTVPMERFSAVVAEKNDAAAKLAAATAKLAQLEAVAATAVSTAEKLTAAEQRAALAETRRVEDVALVRAGIDDDDGIEVARLHWSRLPEQGRPALVDLVGGWKADPTKAPRTLAPYLTRAQPAGPPPPKAPDLPASNAGTAGGGREGQPAGKVTIEEIRAAGSDPAKLKSLWARMRAES